MRHSEQAREQRPRAYEYCINEMRMNEMNE